MKKTIATLGAVATLATGGTVAVDQAIINPYEDKGTHFELSIESDILQGERVEIAKDKAQMTLKGWNDEYAISITPQIPSVQRGIDSPFNQHASRALFSKKMEFKSGAVTAFIEPLASTTNEFDIDFTLDSKPDTNVFEYKISGAEYFNFFYQPALTQQEIDDGASRPDNVVGSYAVYSKAKANHAVGSTNYATGKAFHIYRPKAIDANGVEGWAELNYANGVLSVTVPQDFLDTAVYPVRVDPTFGYTSIGGTSDGGVRTSNKGIKHVPEESGSLSMFSIYANVSASGSLDSALYNSSLVQVETTASQTGGGLAWHDFTVDIGYNFSASTEYLIGVCGSGNAFQTVAGFYDTGNTGQTVHDTGGSACRDPLVDDSLQDRVYSAYATYTASGGATENVQDGYFITW